MKNDKRDDKKNDKKKKKKKHPLRTLILLLILLAMLGGGGFGLWRYGGFEWGYQDSESKETTAQTAEEKTTQQTDTENTETVTETVTETAAETKAELIVVEVSEGKILADGREQSDEKALKDYIMSVYEEGMRIELVDNKAIKDTYDLAKKVLDDLGYTYSERNN